MSDTATATDPIASEILDGLRRPARSLPCKLLYDATGSALFERICMLSEYYPTRIEVDILRQHGESIAAAIGPRAEVIEFGSGSGLKTRMLLDVMEAPAGLSLIEISRAALDASLRRLRTAFPGIPVGGVEGDYTQAIALPRRTEGERRVVFFPGSTIGNFTPTEARAFLTRARHLAGPGGALLLGTDMVKDPSLLEAAYDDAAGVTAAFNRNLLHHCNQLLAGDCDPEAFDHRAPWDEHHRRIDMLLVARADHSFTLGGERFRIRAGESIHTEHSHKFRRTDVTALASRSGWEVERSWYDPQGWFGVHLLR